MRDRPYVAALVLALAVPLMTVGGALAWSALALRIAPPSREERTACPAGQYVTLPAEGYRLADGTFVSKRRAVEGPHGTRLFNDAAGRARCLRPVG